MPLIISRMCLLVLPTIDGNVSLPFPLVTNTSLGRREELGDLRRQPRLLRHLLEHVDVEVGHVVSAELVQQGLLLLLARHDLLHLELRVGREEHLLLARDGREVADVFGGDGVDDEK